MSDRILVLKNGTISDDISRADIASEEDLHHAVQV